MISYSKRAVALGSIALALATTSQVYSAPFLSGVPDINGNGKIDLADVIASGGFVLGDKQFTFDSSSYTPSGATAPAASDITIAPFGTPSGSSVAIQFIFGWSSINGINMDSDIQYGITVLAMDPSTMIDSVDLGFNGAADGAAVAKVTETVFDTSHNQLAQMTVKSDPDGSGPQTGVPSTSALITPNQRSILVDKDITLFSAPSSNGSINDSSISFVDNSYHQTPEPVSLTAIGVGAISMMRRRRSQS